MKNLIKYTIGLPLLIFLTFGFFFVAVIFKGIDLMNNIIAFLLEGKRNYICEISDMSERAINEITDLWRPINE